MEANMTQIAVDDTLAQETQRLSGLPLDKVAETAFKGYLAQLQLRDMFGKLEKDDWFDDEPAEALVDAK
jgi:Arc/MetJ family transcription regulator